MTEIAENLFLPVPSCLNKALTSYNQRGLQWIHGNEKPWPMATIFPSTLTLIYQIYMYTFQEKSPGSSFIH